MSLFVDAEIPPVHRSGIRRIEIGCIGGIQVRAVLRQQCAVFLFKDATVLAEDFISRLIILPVLGHFIDEEEGQGLDAEFKKLPLLFQVGDDGLSDLQARQFF